jgi:NCK-associated protein 1
VLPFRPEEYADLAELQALVRLVGPYGVRAIHRETMKFVASNIPAMKDVLALNRKTLSDIGSSYSKDVTIHMKALKEIDTFINRSIAIGNALQFRQLLLEAQRAVGDKEMPYISHAVGDIFDQYPRNTFMKPEYLELDSLAMTLGLELGSADQALKAVLSKVIGEQDKELWLLLPIIYAAAFVSSKTWAEAIFHPAIEGHANNVHTLSLAINALLVATRATSNSDNEREIVNQTKKFVEAASCILLKQAQQPPRQVEKVVQSLPSVLIFMDKFVDDSPFVTQESLESCLPYALLRSMYKQLYDTKTQGKKGKPVVAPGGAAGDQAEDNL